MMSKQLEVMSYERERVMSMQLVVVLVLVVVVVQSNDRMVVSNSVISMSACHPYKRVPPCYS